MNTTIPKWILAAFVGAAPMLGVVFLILFSCTLLGLVQRCKISIAKSYENRRRRYTAQERTSLTEGENPASTDLKAAAKNLIISPFDEIPMRDIDDDTLSRENSETKDSKLFLVNISYENAMFQFYLFQYRPMHFLSVLEPILSQNQTTIMDRRVFSVIMISNTIKYRSSKFQFIEKLRKQSRHPIQ